MSIQIASPRSVNLGSFGADTPGSATVDFQLHLPGVCLAIWVETLAGGAQVDLALTTWVGNDEAAAATVLTYTATAASPSYEIRTATASMTSHRVTVTWTGAARVHVWAKGLTDIPLATNEAGEAIMAPQVTEVLAGPGVAVTNPDGPSTTVGLAPVGAAGTYPTPASVVTNAYGQVTSVVPGADYGSNPTQYSTQFEDWVAGNEAGVLGWTSTNSGSGSAASAGGSGAEAFNRAQGTAVLPTGTTTSGRSALHLGTPMGLGYGTVSQRWRLWIPILSEVAEEFAFVVGLADSPAGAGVAQTSGAYFVYDRTVSPNWLCVTSKAGVSTTTVTTVPVTNSTFNQFRIEVNATATSVSWWINDVLVATHTTNIPGFVNFVGPLAKIAKSAGTSSRSALLDYMWQRIAWTTPR